jgi:hypothetical protein
MKLDSIKSPRGCSKLTAVIFYGHTVRVRLVFLEKEFQKNHDLEATLTEQAEITRRCSHSSCNTLASRSVSSTAAGGLRKISQIIDDLEEGHFILFYNMFRSIEEAGVVLVETLEGIVLVPPIFV